MNFHLNIVSLKGQIFSGEVTKAVLPAAEGQMTVLANHMPIVAPLTVGEVFIEGEKDIILSIGKGIFTMSGNNADLLIEDVADAEDISEQQALEAKQKAEEILKEGAKGEEKRQAVYALRKSLIDIKIARKSKKRARIT